MFGFTGPTTRLPPIYWPNIERGRGQVSPARGCELIPFILSLSFSHVLGGVARVLSPGVLLWRSSTLLPPGRHCNRSAPVPRKWAVWRASNLLNSLYPPTTHSPPQPKSLSPSLLTSIRIILLNSILMLHNYCVMLHNKFVMLRKNSKKQRRSPRRWRPWTSQPVGQL